MKSSALLLHYRKTSKFKNTHTPYILWLSLENLSHHFLVQLMMIIEQQQKANCSGSESYIAHF